MRDCWVCGEPGAKELYSIGREKLAEARKLGLTVKASKMVPPHWAHFRCLEQVKAWVSWKTSK